MSDAPPPRIGRPPVVFRFKLTHLLPALIQSLIYLYWALYYPRLSGHAPLILAQLVYAYALDWGLSFVRKRSWVLSLGPIPIVLSSNLVLQYYDDIWPHLVIVTLAILSKAFITRDGRHIFNPSGFAISVIGLAALTWIDGLHTGDVSLVFNLPPNMAEVILFLALIVQVRLPVVLVSLGATVAMLLVEQLLPHGAFAPTWAPVTLILALLISDPATIPESPGGKLLFGIFFGAGIMLAGYFLVASGKPDVFGKVLPLPVANLLVPQFDRLGRRLGVFGRALSPRWNVAHVLLWFAIIAGLMPVLKPFSFVPAVDLAASTPFVNAGPSGMVTCVENPLFCRAFTFRTELGCWRARVFNRGQGCG